MDKIPVMGDGLLPGLIDLLGGSIALLGLPKLVITPHLGSASNRTRRRMQEMTVENLRAGQAGKDLPYLVRASPKGALP